MILSALQNIEWLEVLEPPHIPLHRGEVCGHGGRETLPGTVPMPTPALGTHRGSAVCCCRLGWRPNGLGTCSVKALQVPSWELLNASQGRQGTISIISWGQYPSSLGTTAIIPWKNSHRLLGSAQDRAGPGPRGVFPSAHNIRLRPAADVGRGAGGTPLELQSGHHSACAAGSRGLWCCGCSSCPLEGGGPRSPAGLGHAGREQCTPRCTPQRPPHQGVVT